MQQSGVFPGLGREAEYTALGRTWKTSRLTVAVQQRLWEWVKPQLPDYYAPLEKIIDKVDPQKAMMLTSDAAEKMAAMNSVHCEQAQKILGTVEGVVRSLMELLREHHPDITLELAGEIAQELGEQGMQKFVADYNANHPDEPPITVADAKALHGMTADQIALWQVTRMKRVAEGEYPPAPKDAAPAA